MQVSLQIVIYNLVRSELCRVMCIQGKLLLEGTELESNESTVVLKEREKSWTMDPP